MQELLQHSSYIFLCCAFIAAKPIHWRIHLRRYKSLSSVIKVEGAAPSALELGVTPSMGLKQTLVFNSYRSVPRQSSPLFANEAAAKRSYCLVRA